MDQDFKDELDSVVNALRKNGPLKNLSAMQSFCWKHKQAQMSPESGKDYYGFRVDTPKRRYYLRFLPLRGNYNFYIYCYQTDKLKRAAELPPREERMSKQTIKVLVVEPMKPCEEREVPHDYKSLQGIVGGKIEMVSPFTESAAIICNAEGKNLNLPPNRLLCDCYGDPYDVLCGTFLIAGVGGENFISLTDFQLRSYKEILVGYRDSIHGEKTVSLLLATSQNNSATKGVLATMDLEKRLEQYLQSEDFEMDLGDLIHDYRAQGLPVPPMEQLREEATAEAWRCLETIMICEKKGHLWKETADPENGTSTLSCRRCGAVEHLQW